MLLFRQDRCLLAPYFVVFLLCFFVFFTVGEIYCQDRKDEKKILVGKDDGYANTIDEEHCLRSSTFLLIIYVKNASSQSYFFMVWNDRIS